MSFTVLILARGGSERIPRKNLATCCGLSLLGRCIRTCWAAEPQKIIVSTEDPDTVAAARGVAADVVLRPPELATPEATSWDTLRHAIRAESLTGPIVWAQCTNPFMTKADIALVADMAQHCDLAVCVTPTHDLLVDGRMRAINWHRHRIRCQDRSHQYRLAGSCWAFDAEFCLTQDLYTGDMKAVIAEDPVQIDIDTPADLETADAVLRARQQQRTMHRDGTENEREGQPAGLEGGPR